MLDPKQLEMMVLKVLEQLEKEKAVTVPPKKKLYLILPDSWKDTYFDALKTLSLPAEYQVTVVLPDALHNEYYQKQLKQIFPKGMVQSRTQTEPPSREEFLTVFPFPSRGLVAKTALCISDSYETSWIERCFTLGQKILMRKDGMEPFSGKEPKAYRLKIEGYIRTLAEFGIEFVAHVPQSQPALVAAEAAQPQKAHGKRIITEADLTEFLPQKTLLLQPGDVITMLAKERAAELGIQISKVQ